MAPDPLRVISSIATRELLAELAVQYQRQCACPMVTEAGGGVDIAKRVEAGAAVDIVVLASNVIDRLTDGGALIAGTKCDLVHSGVAIAIRSGLPEPAVGSETEVKAAVMGARSVGYSTGPSGTYLEQLFKRWNVWDTVRSKLVLAPPGKPVGQLVAEGQCDLGFQQLSELISQPGIHVLGPLPPEIQLQTTFSGAVAATCAQAARAREALQFFGSADVANIKRRHGMEPLST
jgi:molybdate transport system substrate-binding protein